VWDGPSLSTGRFKEENNSKKAMKTVSVVILLLLASLPVGRSQFYWHAYDPHKIVRNASCVHYESSSGDLPKLVSKYHLWPNLTSPRMQQLATNHENKPDNHTIYGLKYALRTIAKHQHPVDCANAKFLINGFHRGGFGSEIHILGAVLGIAMEWDRVFVANPLWANEWETDNDFCKTKSKKRNFECYYRLPSTCTIQDALGANALNILQSAVQGINTQPRHLLEIVVGTVENFNTNHKIRQQFYEKVKNAKVIIMKVPGWLKYGVIPYQFLPLLHCSPVKETFFYYWWRAIATMYVMRPNEFTLEWISQHRILALEEKERREGEGETDNFNDYLSLFVRRGDKAIEMRLAPLEEYTSAIELLYRNPLYGMQTTKTIFINSEDDSPMKSLKEWNAKQQQKQQKSFSSFAIYTIDNLYNRMELSSSKTDEERKKERSPRHHPLEYLSMVLSIHYLAKGNAFICTLASNFCRLVDELRSTVGGKADRPYVDLSVETCGKPPCLYENITFFDWRRS
jgi:hypothetical protein